MELSRLKTGSRKYGRDTPPPASRPISVFFRKYKNGQNKYRNTGGMGRDFFRPFSSLGGIVGDGHRGGRRTKDDWGRVWTGQIARGEDWTNHDRRRLHQDGRRTM